MGARSSAFLTMTVISIVAAGAAVAVGLAWARRWGGWRATGMAVAGYAVVILLAMTLLPNFHEVPGPIVGPDGPLLDGFPAEVLGEFRVYSLANQALTWLAIGATWACLATPRLSARPRADAEDQNAFEAC